MGRTAKYKKIKSFDPYSKQNGGRIALDTVGVWGLGDNGVKPKKRSRTAERLRQEKTKRRLKRQSRLPNIKSNKVRADVGGDDGFNRPPSGNTDDFDMADLQGSLKRDKSPASELLEEELPCQPLLTVKSSAATNTQQNQQGLIDNDEIKEATQLLKRDLSYNPGKTTKHEGRRENESKKAFGRRVKGETRQIMKQQKIDEKNPVKRQLKKEFLKQKKQKTRKKGKSQSDDNDKITTEYPEIAFGEQAERPPIFKALPVGPSKRESKADSNTSKKTKTSGHDLKAENLEMTRRQIQNQYAMIKAKRKLTGDFHL